MEGVLSLTASGVVLLLLAVPVLFVIVLLLLFGVSFLLPGGQAVSRTSFDCPFSKRRATVNFLVGVASGEPLDVLSCSVFSKPYHVRCKKECLHLTETGWLPSPMMPRFALLADGVTYRRMPSEPELDARRSDVDLARVG